MRKISHIPRLLRMMTSVPKRLALPRLQLLLLVVILGAGLLPNNSMAQDEPASDAEPAAPPKAVNTTRADTGGPVGRNTDTSVWCYTQTCTGSNDCLKKPDFNLTGAINCESGYCYLEIIRGKEGKHTSVVRGCLTWAEVQCLTITAKRKPESCLRFDTLEPTLYEACLSKADPGMYSKKAGKSGDAKIIEGIRFVCWDRGDLCNNRTLSGSGRTGGKGLGYNVALVGALLVSVFPLQRMILVG